MELNINDTVYTFKADFGFLHDVNKRISQEIKDSGMKKEVGLDYMIAGLIDGDVDYLVDALVSLNKRTEKSLTKEAVENYIEKESTNVDDLFEETLGFLRNSNVTRRTVTNLEKRIQEQMKSMDQ